MLLFTKLRLFGFKSFIDPTELDIAPGLTGIVGPNGCGKSNLVEALRWVMGESSAKQMRGGEMDDVVFAGTADRPQRSLAEVTIEIDNGARSAPPPFDAFDNLEVCRRIERGRGSTYRVNGREVRARDVQLLFADAATGARSTALVSQGQVGKLIAAKPWERRTLLEEAAGITGLHTRRHEAELRLRAAEANLERIQDVLAALDAQVQSLKKQARQAARYRTLADQIRKTEALIYACRWHAATAAESDARERLHSAETAVADLTARAAAASARQLEAASALPERRRAENEAAVRLQGLLLAQEALQAEERRMETDHAASATRLGQIAADLGRERSLSAEADATLAELDSERIRLEARRQGERNALDAARQGLAAAAAEVAGLDARVVALAEAVAASEAGRAALTRARHDHETRRKRLADRAEDIARQRRTLDAQGLDTALAGRAEAEAASAQEHLDRAREALDAAERSLAEAESRSEAAAEERRAAETAHARLKAEADALAQLLASGEAGGAAPVLDALTLEPGSEVVLGAALGDDLLAPIDESAPARWRSLGPMAAEPLPAGVRPLSELVRGPAALERRLGHIGIVECTAEGDRLQSSLRPGQRLVSRDGALWRWDGFAVSPAASAAAARLRQRNRLTEVDSLMSAAAGRLSACTVAATGAKERAAAAAAVCREARTACSAAEAAFERARHLHALARERADRAAAHAAALAHAAEAIDAELQETESRLATVAAELQALADPAVARERLADLRRRLDARRSFQAERQAAVDALLREAEGRRRRLDTIGRESASWTTRRETALGHLEVLTSRQRAAEIDHARLRSLPAEIAGTRSRLMGEIQDAEARRGQAADALALAESGLADADRTLRAAEILLAQVREDRIRAEAAVEQAERVRGTLAAHITELLDTAPEHLARIADLGAESAGGNIEAAESRLERLRRERDLMGPVNLRADQEAEEQGQRIATLARERDDLVQAIAKLRRGIGELDREGRQRLLASFEQTDRHFRELFARLFGGGRAHLALTESDDPLEAGLEIIASPPGKRLQALSLLSGGEQALATLALVFAVFRTNPAPICVLDEVDAPLDDANVDRFCSLLEELAAAGGTRFLIITHHRMTMARMDRLFGVTMAERGISQLVSVDLRRAEALRRTA